MNTAFGIDIGGSGIKGAPVNLKDGTFSEDRLRIPTPQPATPKAVAHICAKLLEHFDIPETAPIGITFPAPIKDSVVRFIANLDPSWQSVNVADLMQQELGRPVVAINDADAAGLAEVQYGAAKGVAGTVIATTLGTGIGSALISNGVLIENTELGHLKMHGVSAEKLAAASVRKNEKLNWVEWAQRLQEYYEYLDMLFSPDLIVVGGGVSKKHEKFLPFLNLTCPIVAAQLRNTAGIVGGAFYAAQQSEG